MFYCRNTAAVSFIRKAPAITLILIAMTAILTGCGSGDVETTSLSIDKEGKITSIIYEDFDKDYYDVSELETMASADASTFNSEYLTQRVSVDSVKKIEDSGKVQMIMSFSDCSDYSHFNQVSLFYGTVQEALDKGYNVENGIVDKDGAKAENGFLDERHDNHVIVTSDKMVIYTPYNIEFISEGVVLNGNKEADTSFSESENVVLLLSK